MRGAPRRGVCIREGAGGAADMVLVVHPWDGRSFTTATGAGDGSVSLTTLSKTPALAGKLGGFSDLHSVASLDLVQSRMVSSAATARDRTQLLFELLSAVLEGTGAPILRLTDEFRSGAGGTGKDRRQS